MPLSPPLDTLPPWVPGTPTLGWTVLRWEMDPARRRFIVPDGPRSGLPMVPTARQILFKLWWYAVGPDGLWLMRGAIKRHARGKGKSPEAAQLGLTDFVGPVRPLFDHLGRPREERPGELAGGPVSMPLVHVAGTSMENSENVWRYVLAWAGRGTPLEREFGLDVGKTMLTSPTRGDTRGGVMRQISSSAATVRGARPTLVIADELGEWTSANGGTEFWRILDDNTTKVPYSRILGLGNAPDPGGGSVQELRWDGWEAEQDAVRAGLVEHPFLMDVLEAPVDTDWADVESIREAIAEVYADAPWVDQRQVVAKILDPAKPIQDSQREFGNWRVAAADAWTTPQHVAANRPERHGLDPLQRGDVITLACDPADTDDCTALVAVRMSDGLVEPLWMHDPHAAGRPTDFAELDEAVAAAFELYDVVAFFSDANPAEHYVKTVWPQRYRAQLLVEAATGEPVAFDNRRHRLDMLRATEQAETELREGQWPHSGLATLERHLLNCHRRPTVGYVGVRKGDVTRKIDMAVAAIMGRLARQRVLASKAWRKRQQRGLTWAM